MRWAWILVAVLAGALAAAYVAAEARRQRREFDQARAEIDRGEFATALWRLESLATSRPRWAGGDAGALEYWVGRCRWRVGGREAALSACARVPEGGEYGARAAAFAARGLLEQGRWRAAEERLERALARGGPGPVEVREQLDQVYRLQAR